MDLGGAQAGEPMSSGKKSDDVRSEYDLAKLGKGSRGKYFERYQQGSNVAIPERVAGVIVSLRGQRVILDSDLAELYGEAVKSLVRAVKRNLDRFPADF